MKVVFLDYDGVVNTPIWSETTGECRYGMPFDNKVNNFNATQWLSKFCKEYGYKIVVTSSWRTEKNYKECLYNGGLHAGIEVIGRTDSFHADEFERGKQINRFLKQHPEITDYIILDDDCDILDEQTPFFVNTRYDVGFQELDYYAACRIADKSKN